MNEELIQHQISVHETRINNHSERIDRIETKQAETNVKIDNLCNSLDGLTSVIKWFLGVIITGLGAFFIWSIQNNLF